MKLLILLSTSLIATTSSAGDYCKLPKTSDCVSDCRDIIEKSKQAIAARDKEIADQGQTIKDLSSLNATAINDLNSANTALAAWYHNPVVVGLLGVVLGGTGIVLLQRH